MSNQYTQNNANYAGQRVIATYSMGLAGYEILEANDEYVTYRYCYMGQPADSKMHRAKLHTTAGGRAYFIAGRIRVYLDQCVANQ